MRLPLAFLLVFLLGTCAEARAQGAFVQHGFRIWSDSYLGNDLWDIGMGVGYMVRGIVEPALDIQRTEDDRMGLHRLAIGPALTVYPIHQHRGFPLTLGLTAIAHRLSPSGDMFGDQDVYGEASGERTRFGASIGRLVALNERMNLHTSLAARYSSEEIRQRSVFDFADTYMSYALTTTLDIQTTDIMSVVLTGGLQHKDGVMMAGFGIAFVGGYEPPR